MGVKKWLFLPFLGGSDHPHGHHHRDGHEDAKFKGADAGLTKRESAAEYRKKGEEDIVQDYNAPIRWWVVSTLFPLVAGTFGPMASAFNICAVAIDWRLYVSPSSKESEGPHITDPHWLVAVNAISLAIAIIANLALLAHMTGRIRFNLGAPVVIIGWFISGFIDIALVAAVPTHVPLPANASATWSQAYYYAIFSGVLYVLLSFMLMVTACGIWFGGFSSEFKLSLAQRSLMLQTMLFLGYVLVAGAVYCRIEGWDYLDAVYFTVVTLFTIGFGDLTPETHLGRSLFFPFAVGGIIFVGMIIANIRTLVLESGSVKVSTRLMEKARFKALKSGDPANGIVKVRGIKRRDTNAPTELERREKEFDIMREIQTTAAQNNRLFALCMALGAFMVLWFIGAVAFWQAEKATGGQNWSYFEAIYFTYVAQLTIGYGDFEPQTNSAKPTFVFWSLIALPTLTVLIGAVGDTVTDTVNWFTVWLPKHAPVVIQFVTSMKKRSRPKETLKEILKDDDQPAAQDGFRNIAEVENGRVVPAGMSNNAFGQLTTETAEQAYRPFVMLRAAQQVVTHLDEDPPRQYTFQEWTWLLRLLGEDEGTEDGHRTIGQPLSNGAEVATPVRLHDRQVWSWMGQESPLMRLENDSEAKWVLRKLMEVLEKELKQRGDLHIAREMGEKEADPKS